MRFSESNAIPEEPTPQLPEFTPRGIIEYPQLEVDLDQPSRIPGKLLEYVTDVEGSKQVGEIVTPSGDIYLLVHMQSPDFSPFIMILDDDELWLTKSDEAAEGPSELYKRPILMQGESFDLGDDGHCIITFSEQGRLLVYAHSVNADYSIYTLAKDQDRLPETSVLFDYSDDDPDF